jgi:branched-chain amino acid transport system substrate-binding protein
MRHLFTAIAGAALCLLPGALAAQQSDAPDLPILVPVTGFLALEGASQRNGALLAIEDAGLDIDHPVIDTGTSPEGAVKALQRSLAGDKPLAVAASMLGSQMLAMIPAADAAGVPLVTVSGTAQITEQGSANVFRFFPPDSVVKVAQARFAVEDMGTRKPALIYQTTAYGQSGREELLRAFRRLGVDVVLDEGLDTSVQDMLPVLSRARAAGADTLVLHLHAASTAKLISQARANGIELPVIAGSAMHQPATAALMEPRDLKDVCAETGSSPISEASAGMAEFNTRYQARFETAPDAFAVGQYDGTRMALAAIADGARTPAEVREYLATETWEGLAMTYRSDGEGNMAHDAAIICYDGESRTPKVVARYENVSGIE